MTLVFFFNFHLNIFNPDSCMALCSYKFNSHIMQDASSVIARLFVFAHVKQTKSNECIVKTFKVP